MTINLHALALELDVAPESLVGYVGQLIDIDGRDAVVVGEDPYGRTYDGEGWAGFKDVLLSDGAAETIRDQVGRLVGVGEVARIAGIAPSSVRTYVRRGTIVDPVPVVGSDALVWRRSDVEAWVASRPGRGRPAET